MHDRYLLNEHSSNPRFSRNSDIQLMKYSRSLIATLVMSGSLLQAIAPALAEGAAAGTSLSNTATASYEDPTDPLKPLSTTSNPVVVTVAEVAGITISADGIAKVTGTVGAPVEAGDTVAYNYTVTNTGNDPSKLRIAGAAGITGPGTVQTVERSDDGITWTIVPSGGEYISDSKAPGGFVKVRVTVQVTAGAASNSKIEVTLGNTATPGQQNVALVANGGDVYTVDNAGTANGDVAGAPENGVREASAFQSVTVGATPQAFATVTKVRAATGVTAANTLEYKLGLSVAASAPSGTNKTAEDLAATPINLDNAPNTNKILVSDAVPAGTKAKSLVAPSGWTAVYTTDATGINANDAKWLTAPSNLSLVTGTITRVGFVKNGINATIVKGSPADEFTVVVELLAPASSLKIGNIAQVFGTTKLDATGAPNTTKPVYDESGDSNPNNFNDNGTEPATNPVTSGVVDTATITPADSDANNTNTGSGSAGEPNVYQYVPTALQGVLNGTNDNPDAAGPTGQNDDFTNKSTAISTADAVRDASGNLPKIDPAPLSFANTFKSATNDNVSLVPQAGNLPVGTKVTINYGGNSQVYVVTATGIFNLGSTSTITPVLVTGVVPGAKLNYGVDIDLPAGTAQLTGYSVPVVAFIDSGTAGLDAADKQNTTIDRLYTGYLKIEKEAQILAADGTTVIEAYTKTPTKNAAPGQMIQYRINYTNISDVAPAGSVGLSAQNVKVTEDGATAPNTWGVTVAGKLNTLNKPASALDSNGGSVSFNDGAKNTSNIDVTKYVDTVTGPLTGGQGGSFSFIRVVNPN